MKPNRTKHSHASTLQCKTFEHQAQYWQKLHQLSAVEREDYLRIYDALATYKALTPCIQLMLDTDMISKRVYPLVHELALLVERLRQACLEKNEIARYQLHTRLHNINIAVHAWKNRICLKHSAFLYGQYRLLLDKARTGLSN